MTTDLPVGEVIRLMTQVGGADLTFSLDAKTSSQIQRGLVDKVKIVLTVESKHGQRARVKVQAPESVRILKPEKQAA